jgi:hypothetical protein
MRLYTQGNDLTLSFTSDDCRLLARLARSSELPERFKDFSLGLEASAVSMDRRSRDGQLRGGNPLGEPELEQLTYDDVLVLLEVGLRERPSWRPVYRRLAYYLARGQSAGAGEWDWDSVSDDMTEAA